MPRRKRNQEERRAERLAGILHSSSDKYSGISRELLVREIIVGAVKAETDNTESSKERTARWK